MASSLRKLLKTPVAYNSTALFCGSAAGVFLCGVLVKNNVEARLISPRFPFAFFGTILTFWFGWRAYSAFISILTRTDSRDSLCSHAYASLPILLLYLYLLGFTGFLIAKGILPPSLTPIPMLGRKLLPPVTLLTGLCYLISFVRLLRRRRPDAARSRWRSVPLNVCAMALVAFLAAKAYTISMALEAELPMLRHNSAKIGLEVRKAIVVPVPNEAVFTFETDKNARLHFAFGTLDKALDRNVRFSVSIADESGLSEDAFVHELPPRSSEWTNGTLDLSQYAGQKIDVVFRTSLAGGGDGFLSTVTATLRKLWFYGPKGLTRPLRAVWAVPHVDTPRRTSSPANVILVSIDTLSARHVGCYGYVRHTSPNIDRVAGEGTRFEEVVCTAPYTTPSHMSMFTSLPPIVHGIYQKPGSRLHPARTTLAEVFAEAGYVTAAFTEDVFVDSIFGFDDGFRSYFDGFGSPKDITSTLGYCTKTFARAFRWLEEYHPFPFFLFIHTYQVHGPYTPPAPYNAVFDDTEPAELAELARNAQVDAGKISQAQADEGRVKETLYDGEIRFTDRYIGRLMDKLTELGLDGNTLVIITADHGEEFNEHGYIGHGFILNDGVVLVPLVFWMPGVVPPGQVIPGQVSLLDLMPTILGICGLDTPAEAQGISLAKVISGDRSVSAPDRQHHFSELLIDELFISVRTKNMKLLNPPGLDSSLFDLASDPYEIHDITAESPEKARELEAEIEEYVKNGERVRDEWLSRHPEAEGVGVDPAVLRKLKALGYVGQ